MEVDTEHNHLIESFYYNLSQNQIHMFFFIYEVAAEHNHLIINQ